MKKHKKHKSTHHPKSRHHRKSYTPKTPCAQTQAEQDNRDEKPATDWTHQDTPVEEKSLQKNVSLLLSVISIQMIRAQPNTCFDNAWRLFLKGMPELFVRGGHFIEGWFVVETQDEIVLNEHGWCERSDGVIIDPSVLLLVPPDCPVYYFSGVRRRWQEVADLVQKEVWFPYVRFDGVHGSDGMGHPAYRAAYEAAYSKVDTLGSQSNKKKTFLRAQDLDPLEAAGIEVVVFSSSPNDPDVFENLELR